MNKYTEFSFIRNSLFNNKYSSKLEEYINEIYKSISEKTAKDIFIREIISLARSEIKKENYIIASYLFGLIHNFPKYTNKFDEKQFFTYDFVNFYDHMLDSNRIDILKKVIIFLSRILEEQG